MDSRCMSLRKMSNVVVVVSCCYLVNTQEQGTSIEGLLVQLNEWADVCGHSLLNHTKVLKACRIHKHKKCTHVHVHNYALANYHY